MTNAAMNGLIQGVLTIAIILSVTLGSWYPALAVMSDSMPDMASGCSDSYCLSTVGNCALPVEQQPSPQVHQEDFSLAVPLILFPGILRNLPTEPP